jgi:two-component system sensor histidine kinase BarA
MHYRLLAGQEEMLGRAIKLFIISLISISANVSGQGVIQLISGDGVNRLSSHLYVFRESQVPLSIEQSRQLLPEFTRQLGDNPNYGLSQHGLWLYTAISNITDIEQWVINVGFTQLDKVDMYLLGAGQIIAEAHQGKIRFNQHYRLPTLKATLPYAETIEIFIRIESQYSSLVAPIYIQSHQRHEKVNFIDTTLWGIFYGGLLILAIYNLVLYLGLQEKSLLAYVVYIFTLVIWQFVWGGHLNLVLTPVLAAWFNQHTDLIYVMIGLSSGFFTYFFLDLVKTAPKSLNLVSLNIAILLTLGLCSLFNVFSPMWQNTLVYVAGILAISSYIYAGFESYAHHFYSARYFIIAWGILACSAVISMLSLIGIIPSNSFTTYCFQFGAFVQAGLFSLALMDKSRNKLELDVQQATNDLRNNIELVEEQNVRLDIARKDAIIASNVKSQFLANMSHEIRTPLNAILGFSKELYNEGLPREKQEQVSIINAAADNLLGIVNDVLDFSKIEAGKLRINNHPFSPNEILEEMITVMAKSAHLKGLEFVFQASALPEKLIGDSYRIKQVLNNLLGNALKFTDSGHIGLTASGRELEHGIYELVLKIEDTGIGISRKDRRKLFVAFSQVDDALSRSYQGTGLGLVICQELVKLMRGELSLQSSLGQGSLFTVKIRTNLLNAKPSLSANSEWKDKKILYFDPYPPSRYSGVLLLSQLGASVTGVESLRYLRQLTAAYDMLFICVPHNKEGDLPKILEATRQVNASRSLLLYSCSESMTSRTDFSHNFSHKLRLPLTLGKLNELERAPVIDPVNHLQQRLSALPAAHVLAVDDMEINLRLLSTWLKASPLQLTLAYSGKDALTLCQQHEFDLVLMDVQMPNMDGLQASQLIRQTELNLGTPIIALTAHAFKEEQERLLSSGMDDYLPKPLDLSDLVDLIKRWCHQAQRPLEEVISVDWPLALKRANHNIGAAKDVFEQFIAQLPGLIKAIEEINMAQDFASLQAKVHQLHGACCYTGAPGLQALCNTIESALKRGQFEEAQQHIPALIDETARVLTLADKIQTQWA